MSHTVDRACGRPGATGNDFGVRFLPRGVRAQQSDPLEGLSRQISSRFLMSWAQEQRPAHASLMNCPAKSTNCAVPRMKHRLVSRLHVGRNAAQIAAVGAYGVTVSVVDAGANLTSTRFRHDARRLRSAGAEAIELNGIHFLEESSLPGAGRIADGRRNSIASPLHVKSGSLD